VRERERERDLYHSVVDLLKIKEKILTGKEILIKRILF